MRISNSKKELARIINENGGWPDGAHWMSQDRDGGVYSFAGGKPVKHKDMWCLKSSSEKIGWKFAHAGAIKNWHQTILSRDEYFHLYPAPDAVGWIKWGGGMFAPVIGSEVVDVMYANGAIGFEVNCDSVVWENQKTPMDYKKVVAYRLHKPEILPDAKEPKPAQESMPTIEQLAAEYRNAKDYAERKQREADDAKADAEAMLKALELAGEALGLLVSPITANQESELAIEFKVGDEVECVESNIKRDKYNGTVGRLHLIDESDTSTPYLVDFGGDAKIWCHEVKFIRRP